ncbi:MAG: hypothetical protein II718_04250 [Clostridiales bacterium]|nr:hypothetical protein [Clostridiales bacterium]
MENENYEPIIDGGASGNTPVGNDKVFAILAYIGILWLVGLLVAPEKDHAFVKNHVNNGILLSIAGIVTSIICVIPILGWILGILLGLAILVFWIMALVAAIKGEMHTLPIIGDKVTLIK